MKLKQKRNIEIVFKLLLPAGRLDKIAKTYGISRARVQQIFKGIVGKNYKTLKNVLSSYVKCIWCGRSLRMTNGTFMSGTRYCDYNCKTNAGNYENRPHICNNCKKLYLPYTRNQFYANVMGYCSKKCFNLKKGVKK